MLLGLFVRFYYVFLLLVMDDFTGARVRERARHTAEKKTKIFRWFDDFLSYVHMLDFLLSLNIYISESITTKKSSEREIRFISKCVYPIFLSTKKNAWWTMWKRTINHPRGESKHFSFDFDLKVKKESSASNFMGLLVTRWWMITSERLLVWWNEGS